MFCHPTTIAIFLALSNVILADRVPSPGWVTIVQDGAPVTVDSHNGYVKNKNYPGKMNWVREFEVNT